MEDSLAAFLGNRLDYDFLLKNRFIPLAVDHERKLLEALTSDPFNSSMSDYVVKNLGYAVRLILAPEKTVDELARSYLDGQDREFVSLVVEEDAEKLKEMAFEAPVIKYLNSLLNKAVEMRASDIQYRVFGEEISGPIPDLREFCTTSIRWRRRFIRHGFAHQTAGGTGHRGKEAASDENHDAHRLVFLDIRVSTLPTFNGEGVVLRLLFGKRFPWIWIIWGWMRDHKAVAWN